MVSSKGTLVNNEEIIGNQDITIIDCQCMDFIHKLEGVSCHVLVVGKRFEFVI